jgi:tetratricopeptide (TPR) repeat protein
MYNNIMTKFRWGGMSTPGVYLDENSLRFASNMRIQMGALASTLVAEGKKDKAIQILDKAMKEMPEETVPYDATIYSICIGYFQAGENKKAAPLAEKIFSMFEKDLKYYNRLPAYHKSSYANEIRRAKELMISLVGVTRSNGEMELSKKFESRLPAVISAEEMQSFGRPQPVQK